MDDNSSNEENARARRSFIYAFGLYGGVGLQLAVSVAGGMIGGKVIDEKLSTSPWFLILGVTLGTVAGFYNLVRVLNQQQKLKEKEGRR